MEWLRLYHEVRTDKEIDELTDAQFRIWVNLLLFASEQKERGVIFYRNLKQLALQVARKDVETLKDTLEVLAENEMISWDEEEAENKIKFLHFAERQYDRPSDHPAAIQQRVQRHRQAKKEDVKRDVTPGNDVKRDVTHESRSRAEQSRFITEAEQSRAEEEGPGETTAPPTVVPASVQPASPAFLSTGACSAQLPDLARPAHSLRLSDADWKDLLKGATRQQIEWALEIVSERPVPPRNLKNLLYASILPEVRDGDRPARLLATAHSPPTVPEKPAIDAEAMARLEAGIAVRAEQRLRAIALIEAREREQQNANPK